MRRCPIRLPMLRCVMSGPCHHEVARRIGVWFSALATVRSQSLMLTPRRTHVQMVTSTQVPVKLVLLLPQLHLLDRHHQHPAVVRLRPAIVTC
jgi:hypothetical protein